MQSKINAFFKAPSPSAPESPLPPLMFDDDDLTLWEKKEHEYVNIYKRRAPKPDAETADKGSIGETHKQPNLADSCLKPEPAISRRNLNKKRSYAQLYLDLGQSDFLLRTCSSCGIKYTPGEKEDEKAHKAFHNNYTLGIKFRGWQNETVAEFYMNGPRILQVSPYDHHAQRKKVQEVVKLMEVELGEGWIYHKRCQAYLFVSEQLLRDSQRGINSQRIVGCVVAEPIKEAYKIISCSADGGSNGATTKKARPNSTALQFGEVAFQREVMKRASSVNSPEVLNGNLNGAIFCEKEAVRAVCGIRAIWVTPSNRRKTIATQLLDAVRHKFHPDGSIVPSYLAFSQPTLAGKALASKYFGTESFLVYKADNSNC